MAVTCPLHGAGEFRSPTDVCIVDDAALCVVESCRVQLLSLVGEPLQVLRPSGCEGPLPSAGLAFSFGQASMLVACCRGEQRSVWVVEDDTNAGSSSRLHMLTLRAWSTH